MYIFLDTADYEAIKKWASTSLIDGITTNPTLLSRANPDDPDILLKELCTLLGDRDVSIEVTQEEPEKVYQQAHEIAKIADNAVVKIPCKTIYVPVIEKLIADGIRINITLIFSATQALMMAKLGVDYVSPFIGRLEDSGQDGLKLISDIRQIFSFYDYETEILAASIRSVDHVREVALRGADVATLPVKILEESFNHPLTDKGIARFLADWKKTAS